jgi:hypothetical protein
LTASFVLFALAGWLFGALGWGVAINRNHAVTRAETAEGSERNGKIRWEREAHRLLFAASLRDQRLADVLERLADLEAEHRRDEPGPTTEHEAPALLH